MYYPIIPDPIYFYNRQIWFQCLVHIALPPDMDPDIYIYIYSSSDPATDMYLFKSPHLDFEKSYTDLDLVSNAYFFTY